MIAMRLSKSVTAKGFSVPKTNPKQIGRSDLFPQILGELSDEACALTLAIPGVSAPQHLVGGGLEKGC